MSPTTSSVSVEQRRAELRTVISALEAEATAIAFDPAFDSGSFLGAIDGEIEAAEQELFSL